MPPQHPTIAHALGLFRARLRTVLDDLRDHTVLVAWSAGPDSGAMLGLWELLAPGLQVRLVVGHVDHGLRAESRAEADMVRHAAAARGHRIVVRDVALSPGPGLPARARDARRRALRAMADDAGAVAISLGHTATDQAETMLLHLARGAGLDGLSGMPPVDRDNRAGSGPRVWLRPLLDLDRDQTRALVERFEIPYVDDPTNADPDRPRTAVRHQVLPVLHRHHARATHAMVAAADQIRDADEALEAVARHEMTARRVDEGIGRGHPQPGEARPLVRYSTRGFDRLPRAVRTRVIRQICVRGGVDPSALGHRIVDAIDTALSGISEGTTRGWDLKAQADPGARAGGPGIGPAANLRLCHDGTHLWVTLRTPGAC